MQQGKLASNSVQTAAYQDAQGSEHAGMVPVEHIAWTNQSTKAVPSICSTNSLEICQNTDDMQNNLHNLHDATLVIATGVTLHVVLHAFFDFAIRCSMCVGTADMTHMLSSLGARPPKRPD